MDRDKVTKPTAQIGFIKFVLIPLFELLSKVTAFFDVRVSKKLQEVSATSIGRDENRADSFGAPNSAALPTSEQGHD